MIRFRERPSRWRAHHRDACRLVCCRNAEPPNPRFSASDPFSGHRWHPRNGGSCRRLRESTGVSDTRNQQCMARSVPDVGTSHLVSIAARLPTSGVPPRLGSFASTEHVPAAVVFSWPSTIHTKRTRPLLEVCPPSKLSLNASSTGVRRGQVAERSEVGGEGPVRRPLSAMRYQLSLRTLYLVPRTATTIAGRLGGERNLKPAT